VTYEFHAIRRVEFSETDMEGIMHFSNFFKFMETAEHGFFRSMGYSVVLSRNGHDLCLPRVHAECDYLAPLRFEDEVNIRLLVEKKGPRSLTCQFRFYRLSPSTPQLVAHGRLTVVCTARQKDGSFKAVPFPRALAEQIQEAPTSVLASEIPARRASSPSGPIRPAKSRLQRPPGRRQPKAAHVSRFTHHRRNATTT
jgi:YbgC/YbaW family acyl-CoA thioester hydrolase